MREIFFRGKIINSEEWAEGNYLYDEFSGTSVIVPYINLAGGNVTDFSEHSAAAVITDTVGQYTGLTDKNGNKIFEGDIVKLTFSEVVGKIICDVNYYIESDIFDRTTRKLLGDYSPYDLEILGNIHDNPQLLEVQNEQG